jgi:hypothetical protein
MECAPKDMAGNPLRPITAPLLTEMEAKQLKQCAWMLQQTTKPAKAEPEYLVQAVKIAMQELPYRTRSSEDLLQQTIRTWATDCWQYPLWAVLKAAGWWNRGAREGEELGDFLKDVRLACGHNVLERKKLMIGLLNGQA